ncbi:small ribosomal subunit protein cS23-like [Nicotiana tabacum]|uniref:30S ribosomal protein 3, chloroplastic n=1 Tax=Nicotiana tabacum TaxID=4097 RepID=A0A1S4A558_TOBAC|nr:PREDICTED: 30S ribosomal protein 3, chloroplastic-like [Nicotiana tabacum]
MMLSAATLPTVNWVPAFFSQKHFSPKIVSFAKQQQSLSRPFNVSALKPRRNFDVFASSAVSFAGETSTQNSVSSAPLQKEKLGVVVKPLEKPRLVLKFIWMEKNIGIALDQVIPGHGTIPLSPYYFWPRKDAWEELKIMLESKPWISQKQIIILLNQATDIINLWQQSGGDLA